MSRARALALAAAVGAALAGPLAACATFEDPTIVIDLRVVGMTAEPPEQVLELDLSAPPSAGALTELIEQLASTRVCAYLADPAAERELHWTMTACLLDEDRLCDPARPLIPIANATLADPERTPFGGVACGRVEYDADPAAWIALLTGAIERDPTRGLGGISYAIELRAGGLGAPPELDIIGVKQVRLSARIPDTKVANNNPTTLGLQLSVNNGAGEPAVRQHCADPVSGAPFVVQSGDVVTLFPIEPETGIREEFFVATLDGGFERYTEVLSYQWLGAGGSFADAVTGGPPDIFGNQALLGTDWTAPPVGGPTDVQIWVIQRDERLGASVRETCIRVAP